MFKAPTIRMAVLLFGSLFFMRMSQAQQTINFTFTQSPLPQADFGITYKPDRVSFIFLDSSVVTNQNITLWFWDFGDGNSSTAQYTSHTYAQKGVYNVCLAIKTDNSCRDTVCKEVNSWLGIGDNGKTKESLKITPNPFKDKLSIQFEIFKRSEVSVEVYNMIGERLDVLMNGQQDPRVVKLNYDPTGDNNNSGVYFIKITNEDVVLTEKVVRTL